MTAEDTTTTRVAVIGLGSMGMGIASSLLRAGFQVNCFDISPDLLTQCAQEGAVATVSPAEAARGQQVVFSVVVNQSQTESVLFGSDGAAQTMAKGGVFISCATMAPDAARDLAQRLEVIGPHYLDAPISGGAARAARGELTVLASGSEAAFTLARPALAAVSTMTHELGSEPGTGAGFKMINQLLAGVHIVAAAEAMAFAAKQNLDLDRVYEVITGSAGNSWMFENRVPHILTGDYTPLSTVEIFVKDMGIIADMARAERFPAPLAAAALQLYLAASGSGHGREDDAAVAKVYAALSGATLPRPSCQDGTV